jgi:hypothetical protein
MNKQPKTGRSRRMPGWRGTVGAMALALAVVPAAGAIAKDADQSAPNVAAAVAALAAQIRDEIKRHPVDASVETFQAGIMYLADQSGQPQNIVCAAFDVVRPEATTPQNARTALSIVCQQMRGRRGTGAIGNSGPGFGSSGFSGPVISTGGGSSNYAP